MQRLMIRRWFLRLALPAVFALALFLGNVASGVDRVEAYGYPYCGPATGPCFYGGYGAPYVTPYVTPYVGYPYVNTYVTPYIRPYVYPYYAGYPYAGYYWYR